MEQLQIDREEAARKARLTEPSADDEAILALQRRLLLAYTSWLADRERLTFTPERLVEAYMVVVRSDDGGSAH